MKKIVNLKLKTRINKNKKNQSFLFLPDLKKKTPIDTHSVVHNLVKNFFSKVSVHFIFQ